jgi:2-succinyl-6-hydroxy-2,4-cyclohexadiene-1-carboxylate synthase
VVVFVPGFMQRAEAWDAVADRTWERYPSRSLEFETWTWGERLDELRAACPPGAVVVGYSRGGRLALAAAAREPDCFGGLVVLGAAAGIEDPTEREARRVADDEFASWIETHTIEEVVARWEALPVLAGQPPALVERQRAGRLDHDPVLLARLLRSGGPGAAPAVWDRLRHFDRPLLALAGERDEKYVALARRLAAVAPWAQTGIVPGAGHAAHLERPAEVSALLLQFLDEHFTERVDADLHT